MSTLFPDFQTWGQMGKMASSPFMSLPFLLLIITPLIQPALSDLETQELIDEICQQCEDYGFCYRTFNENLKTPTTDAQGLVQITTVQSLYHATNTYILVKKHIANTSDATVRGHLRICDNGYNAGLNSFQEAFRSFNLKNYRSMMAYEWDTQRAVAACDAIFSVAFLSTDQLIGRNKKMRMLITMALQNGSGKDSPMRRKYYFFWISVSLDALSSYYYWAVVTKCHLIHKYGNPLSLLVGLIKMIGPQSVDLVKYNP